MVPDRFHWIAYTSGQGWRGDPERNEERMPPGPWIEPGAAYGHRIGETVHRQFRYEKRQATLEPSNPQGLSALATAATKSAARAIEKEAKATPLFANDIRAEGKAPRKKRK